MDTTLLSGLIITLISPWIAFAVGLVRLKKMDGSYYPFIAIMGVASITEFIRITQLFNYYLNLGLPIGLSIEVYNIYVLAIGILYPLLFYKWGLLRRPAYILQLIIGALVLIWVIDHFVYNGYQLPKATKFYRLTYSLLLCLFAIHHINKLIVREKKMLLRNSSFLICLGLLFFFIPYIIIEGIFLFNPKTSPDFYASVFEIRSRYNPVIYLIFTVAILWIPPKKPFIQLFS
jgi:hypothetical protein